MAIWKTIEYLFEKQLLYQRKQLSNFHNCTHEGRLWPFQMKQCHRNNVTETMLMPLKITTESAGW